MTRNNFNSQRTYNSLLNFMKRSSLQRNQALILYMSKAIYEHTYTAFIYDKSNH